MTDASVSRHLARWAAEAPARLAVRGPEGHGLCFEELDRKSNRLARGLLGAGLERGDRACLFLRPGPELIALTHALFRVGAVPVLIDPGMGRAALLACVERIAPRALIGVPRVHVARLLFPRAFRSVHLNVTVGRRLGWSGTTLAALERGRDDGPLDTRLAAADEAAILFTSGSTGPPKGVLYTHGIFDAQLRALAELYTLEPGEVDVACFPLFALFDNALGMSSVFPALDPSRPATCDPAAIWRALQESDATFTFGSPAIWRRVAPWARARGLRSRTLRRITIAGAPVPPSLLADLLPLLPEGGDVHTPYGATECLPVASISAREVLTLRERIEGGEGTCVGRPAPGIELALIPITDGVVQAPFARVEPGAVGEICARGAVVTPRYEHDPDATALAKIEDEAGRWHRMGDVGCLDEEGRLWFHGRKSHRLETDRGLLMPVPVENVFNTLDGVHRTALVGVGPAGKERPHLVVEPERGARQAELEPRLRERVAANAASARVEGFLFHERFPVDVRHNAKIHRGELKRWAQARRP